MLTTIPPLWRDLDSYNQVTRSPGASAAGGHGPLYGLAARLPLYAGYLLERVSGQTGPWTENFYEHPRLTDSGIFLLLVAQHLALAAAVLTLIISAARRFWMRFALATLFALNPVFYTFAQCVGSESLSLICIVLFAAAGLRLLRSPGTPTRNAWIVFGVTLFAAIFARYANLLLLLALPLTYLLVALLRRSRDALRNARIAFAIGMMCLVGGRISVAAVCRIEGMKYFSRSGVTFLWRASFLQNVPEPRRSALLETVAARTNSADARQVISLLSATLRDGLPIDAGRTIEQLQATLASEGKPAKARRIHQALNEALRAFLAPPTPEHWAAAQSDFARALRMRPPEVVEFLFLTTAYYFAHRESMPEVAQLVTFRDYSEETLWAIPRHNAYFQLWRNVSMNQCLLLCAAGAMTLLIISGRSRIPDLVVIASYGIILVLAGLGMVEATALIGEIIPRYTLPLWALVWLACLIYAGAIADTFGEGKVRRAPREAGCAGWRPLPVDRTTQAGPE